MSAKIWNILYEIECSDSDKICLATYYIPDNRIFKIWDSYIWPFSIICGPQASHLNLGRNSEKRRLSSCSVIVYRKYLVIADLVRDKSTARIQIIQIRIFIFCIVTIHCLIRNLQAWFIIVNCGSIWFNHDTAIFIRYPPLSIRK